MKIFKVKRILTVLMMGGYFLGLTFNALAADKVATWTGGNGDWNVPGNWDINEVPNNGVFTYDVVIPNGTTLNLNIDVTIEKLTKTGNLVGSQSLTANGLVTLSGGDIYIPVFNANGGMNITGVIGFGTVQLNNAGTANFTAGAIAFHNAGVINNLPGATFNVTTDHAGSNTTIGGAGVFNNQGNFVVNAPVDTPIGMTFNNSGQVIIQANNTLVLTLDGTQSGSFSGAGTLALHGSNKILTSSLNITTSKLIFRGGANINGDFELIYDGEFDWDQSNVYLPKLNLNGHTNILGIVQIGDNTTVNNSGTVDFTAGVVNLLGHSILNNIGTFNLLTPDRASNGVAIAGSLDAHINNQGTFMVNTPGNSGVGVPFNNFGTMNIDENPFIISNYIQPSGETQLVNSNISSSSLINIQGGILSGAGSINADVDMAGRIEAGPSIGTLTIEGDLTFEPGSELFLEFQRVGGVVTFDKLVVNGEVFLNGGMLLGNIIANDGFVALPDTLSVLDADVIHEGAFENIPNGGTLVTFDGFGRFDAHYGTDSAFDPDPKYHLILNNFNNPGGALPPDLTLISSDISFTPVNPAPANLFNINASVKNNGQSPASNVKVRFLVYEPGAPGDHFVSLGEITIPTIAVGQSSPAVIQTIFPADSFRLIKVVVDPDNTILELKENNNQASQILQVGHPDPASATLRVFSGDVISCQHNPITISGQAYYDFDTLPSDKDFPVEGGKVTVFLKNHTNGQILGTFIGALTDVNGNFSQSLTSPDTDGVYDLEIEVTDFTLTGKIPVTPQTLTLTINGVCPLPPNPPEPCTDDNCPANPPPPAQVKDIFVNSQGITFNHTNPDLGQTIDISSLINYQGTDPVFGIPVTINDLYPVAGEVRSFKIFESFVDFSHGEAGSPAQLTVPWNNTAEGAHIIQVETSPTFAQPTNNDKATRLIFIGDIIEVTLKKNYSLLLDADNNNIVSPGDTLEYTLEYENKSENDLTGAFIIDDYDEQKININPADVSSGGVIQNGTIRWNIGSMLTQGGVHQVSYKAVINVTDKDTLITNAAFLKTDQTPTVGDVRHIYVTAPPPINIPPVCNAGVDRTILSPDEHNTIIPGTASDDDHDTLTYQWFKQQGATEVELSMPVQVNQGQTILNLGTLAMPLGVGAHTLILKVSDAAAVCTDSMVLTINSPPVASCTVKTDYTPGIQCAASTVVANNDSQLDAYLSNFGHNGTKFQNLKINYNVTRDNIIIHSPCKITIKDNAVFTGQTVCLDGRNGIIDNNGYRVTANKVTLLSETDDADLGAGSIVTADQLTIQAFKTAKIGINSRVNATGPVSVKSTGNLASSEAIIKEGTTLSSRSLAIEASKGAAIGENVTVNITNGISVVSTGDSSGSEAIIKQNSTVNAGSLNVSASRGATLGQNVRVNLNGQAVVTSTGNQLSSEAQLKQGARVTALSLDLSSGNKATLGPGTKVTTTGNFKMQAASINKCSVAGSAVFMAGSHSGNCLE